MLIIILAFIGLVISGSLLWASLVKGELRLSGSKTLGPGASRVVGVLILPVFLFCLGIVALFVLAATEMLPQLTAIESLNE